MDAIKGPRKSYSAVLASVATGIEHPPGAAGTPYRGFAQTLFVEGTRTAEFQNRIGAKFLPCDPILRSRDAQALPSRTILAEVKEIEPIVRLKYVWICHGALIEASTRPQRHHGSPLFFEGLAIKGARKRNSRRIARLIPVVNFIVDH